MSSHPFSRTAARILVIDDEAMYRSVLGEQLCRVGYHVLEAPDGEQGLLQAQEQKPDLIILDVCMPGIDGFSVCRELRSREATHETPVLLLTGLSDRDSRFEGLASGADDFLSKPVFSAELLTRVRNLLKIKFLKDQLDAVQSSVQQMLFTESVAHATNRVLLVTGEETRKELSKILEAENYVINPCPPAYAVEAALASVPELIVLEPLRGLEESLEDCRKLRQHKSLRSVSVLLYSPPLETLQRLAAFAAGVDECLSRPIDPLELVSRVALHARRQREQRHLEERLQTASQRAIIDGLTGAHNRAFFDHYLDYQCKLSARQSKPLSIIMIDLDHFKGINDRFGHSYGDEVLRKVVELIRGSIRASDVLCRFGGEEFAVLLPDTGQQDALIVAERIRAAVASHQHEHPLAVLVTISLGVAAFGQDATSAPALIEAADQAMYRAKLGGRNRTAILESDWIGPQAANVESIFRGTLPSVRPGLSG